MSGLSYSVVRIFTDERARWKGAPLHEAIVRAVAHEKCAARCVVSKGLAGCLENGEVFSHRVLDLSYDMPLTIEIILPTVERDALLARIETMVSDGIVTTAEADVFIHRSTGGLIPRGLLVRDVMTSPAVSVNTQTALRDCVAVLVRSEFDGVPVVDEAGRLVGMVTQAELTARAGLHARPEVLGGLWRNESIDQVPDSALFTSLTTGRTASDVMITGPPTIEPGAPIDEAIKMLAAGNLKRLAVTDKEKHLVGMVARIDVLRLASAGAKRRRVLEKYGVKVPGATPIGSTELLQVPTVALSTPASDVMDLIDGEGQRVIVLDEEGAPLGVISDRDLLPLLGEKGAKKAHDLTAGSLMRKDIPTVADTTSIDQAVELMVELRRKRLPVLNHAGKYVGMLSREELLRILVPEDDT